MTLKATYSALFAIIALGGLASSGCGSSENKPSAAKEGETQSATAVDHSHGGWWCVEHGVPEEECALCQTSLVAKFKADGDWCEEHSRPESQCFLCDPSRFEKFAARYEAKVGRKPPQPEE